MSLTDWSLYDEYSDENGVVHYIGLGGGPENDEHYLPLEVYYDEARS